MSKTATILFLLLASTQLVYAGHAVDVGFYATSIRSDDVMELEVLDKKDVSVCQTFGNGEKRKLSVNYIFECKVLNALNSTEKNITLDFSVNLGIEYDEEGNTVMQVYYFNNHSGLEFELKKGDKFVGLINDNRLMRAENITYEKGLEMYNASHMMEDYLVTKNTALYDNDYYWRVSYVSLDTNMSSTNKIIYYDPVIEKLVLIKDGEDIFQYSDTIKFNHRKDSLTTDIEKNTVLVNTSDSSYVLSTKTLQHIKTPKEGN